MARAVFSAPGDEKAVVVKLRNLAARLNDLRDIRPVSGSGSDYQRIVALETKVNEILARLVAITKE